MWVFAYVHSGGQTNKQANKRNERIQFLGDFPRFQGALLPSNPAKLYQRFVCIPQLIIPMFINNRSGSPASAKKRRISEGKSRAAMQITGERFYVVEVLPVRRRLAAIALEQYLWFVEITWRTLLPVAGRETGVAAASPRVLRAGIHSFTGVLKPGALERSSLGFFGFGTLRFWKMCKAVLWRVSYYALNCIMLLDLRYYQYVGIWASTNDVVII